MTTVIQRLLTDVLVVSTIAIGIAITITGCTTVQEKNTSEPVAGIRSHVDEVSPETPPEIPEHIQKKLRAQGISSPSTDVVIRPTEKGMIQEYRTNGILYAIKVVPKLAFSP